jgi:hypothetical protein
VSSLYLLVNCMTHDSLNYKSRASVYKIKNANKAKPTILNIG